MKPLRGKNAWPKLAVYDIEATDWVNVVCLCHVDEYGNREAFSTVERYLYWLYSDKFQGEHVWAHWGGHYDHRFIISYATQNEGWSWEAIQSGSLLVIVRVKAPNGRIISFCESARLMPDSVAKIGKTIGLDKLDVDRKHIEKLSMKETVTYCFRDCDIVIKGMQYLRTVLESVDADFAYTLASISTRWVRRSDVLQWMKFYDKAEGSINKWQYSTAMQSADKECLEAYFGGRVEVFRAGTFQKKLYYYDIRSSYPWSMTNDLPSYFIGTFAPPKSLTEALNHCGISEATIHIPKGTFYFPILPVRYKGKLIFPEGTFRGRWTNLELQALWDRGRYKGVKIQIHGQWRFQPKKFLKPFVDTFYKLRQQAITDGDTFRSYTFKIALNSLYGKLVETVDKRSIVYGDMVNEAIKKHGAQALDASGLPPGIYAVHSTVEGPFRHVAAGCYVTAYSRLRLLEGMEEAHKIGAAVYYCDTDSIVIDKKLPDTEDVLGSFKLEETLVEAEFLCPKVYRMRTESGKDIYKVKGMPIKGNTEEESKARWDIFTQNINHVAPTITNELIAHVREELEYHNKEVNNDNVIEFLSYKEGLSGFKSDLNRGSVEPRAIHLKRKLNNEDSKRIHTNMDSAPLYLEGSG